MRFSIFHSVEICRFGVTFPIWGMIDLTDWILACRIALHAIHHSESLFRERGSLREYARLTRQVVRDLKMQDVHELFRKTKF